MLKQLKFNCYEKCTWILKKMYLAFLDLECPWLLLGEAFSVDGEHCQGGGVHPCERKCCRGLDS